MPTQCFGLLCSRGCERPNLRNFLFEACSSEHFRVFSRMLRVVRPKQDDEDKARLQEPKRKSHEFAGSQLVPDKVTHKGLSWTVCCSFVRFRGPCARREASGGGRSDVQHWRWCDNTFAQVVPFFGFCVLDCVLVPNHGSRVRRSRGRIFHNHFTLSSS